jgi:APA family basic amino acid/polyamine antiporter
MIIGLDVYLLYGMKKSFLNKGLFGTSGYKVVSISGMVMSILLIAIAITHHYFATENDNGLYYFSLVFSVIHIILFGIKVVSSKPEVK